MKHHAIRKLEGYAVHNPCMPTSIEVFFSGSHDTYKKGMPENNKELCEKYIIENHPNSVYHCVPATLYYEVPESHKFCRKGVKCSDNVCFCDEK